MNIKITTFKNPFSFFCVLKDSKGNEAMFFENETNVDFIANKANTNEFHGQYVAVMWRNEWVRGVISMESQFLIWLIDYGIYIKPNDKYFYKDLPLEYRKTPTKIFEASIHGVVPVDKDWSWVEGDKFENRKSRIWTPGSIEVVQKLLKKSLNTYFRPFALLTTQTNHVVLGDLFLETHGKGLVNLVDQLKKWPVFLEENHQAYVENMIHFYKGHRHHHSCCIKPDLPGYNIPNITLQITLDKYLSLVEKLPAIDTYFDNESILEDSTVVGECKKDKTTCKITPEDMEKYSKRVITLNGREYNVLNILINKARDLNICEKYKDYDLKSIGRGISSKFKNF